MRGTGAALNDKEGDQWLYQEQYLEAKAVINSHLLRQSTDFYTWGDSIKASNSAPSPTPPCQINEFHGEKNSS